MPLSGKNFFRLIPGAALLAVASAGLAADPADVAALKSMVAAAARWAESSSAPSFDGTTRRELERLAAQVRDEGLRARAQQLVPELERASLFHRRVRALQEQVKQLRGKATIDPGGPDWLTSLVGRAPLFDRLTEIELNEHTDGHAERKARPKDEAVSDRWLKKLDGLPDLIRLELSGTSISDAGLAPIGSLTRLERLNICLTPVTDGCLTQLAPLTNLRRLVICSTKVTGTGFTDVPAWPRIESINLHSCPVSDDGLAAISRFSSLQRLEIVHSQVTDVGLAHLSRLTNLRQLHVASHGATRRGLDFVARLQHLYQLDVYEKLASNEGLAEAGKLAGLKILNLYAGPVDDSGLAVLPRLTKLEELTLGGLANITDAAVDHLGTLKNLKQLHVNGTKISAAGLARLRAALPATEVGR